MKRLYKFLLIDSREHRVNKIIIYIYPIIVNVSISNASLNYRNFIYC